MSLKNLDWHEILNRIEQSATSDSAKHLIAKTKALGSPQEAEKSFAETRAAQELLGTGVRPHMQSLDLFSPWALRLKKGAVLKTLEIRDVRSFCLETLALKESLKPLSSQWAKDLTENLMSAEEPLSAIDQILTPSGDIRMDASEKLFRLSKERETLARQVENTLDRLVRDHQMENLLQEKYVTTREGRWVLPIRGGMQHFMPGVIHGTSQTKQTVFMEPDSIIPLNNRLREIEIEVEDEIERLLTELSKYLQQQLAHFENSRNWLESTDVKLAQAQFATMINAEACEFSETLIELNQLRHPVLALTTKNLVSNTILLNQEKSILLLSGPNAGGKTILLKSIGLAAQMARCGLLIAANEGSKIPFFHSIEIGIGDSQSVDENLSTFAAHLKILDQASKQKGANNLILIDEICGSTDPEEGSALARSFIERFSQNEVFAIITSHLGPLKVGWKETDRVLNGSMEYDGKTGRPTYQFISGVPGESLAIQTAKRVGVDTQLVARAIEHLAPASRARLEAMEEIEQMKKDIHVLQDHLKRETQKTQEQKRKLDQKLSEFEKQKEEWLAKTLKKAEKKVEDAIASAKAAETLNKHRSLQEIKYNLPEIVKAKNIVVDPHFASSDEFAKKYPTGSKVFVPSLNQDGIVQSQPNSKGEVLVLSNSIRLQLHWQELKPPQKAQNPTSQLVRQSPQFGSQFTVALQEQDRTLDLRGMTVEDALEELEVALDKAVSNKEDRIKIIHGHGTEALKKSVRTYLSRSIYVNKWKSGANEQGGDGITWAELAQS